MYSKQNLAVLNLFGFISVIGLTALLKLALQNVLLAFIASIFRVTEENLLFETDLYCLLSLF